MYDLCSSCEKVKNALTHVETALKSAHLSWNEQSLRDIDTMVEKACALRDRAYKSFAENYNWVQDGHRSRESAIEEVTSHPYRNIRDAIEREEIFNKFPKVKKLAEQNKITSEHVDQFSKLLRDRIYSEYLEDNIEPLIENAPHVSAAKFSTLVKHWKFSIDNSYRYGQESYEVYQKRTLSIYQLPSGGWNVEGFLDEQSGTILHKALEDITQKIWRNCSKEQAEQFSIHQSRADAIGYLAQGYVTQEIVALAGPQTCEPITHARSATRSTNEEQPETLKTPRFSFTSPLTADLTIDVIQIKTDKSIASFVRDCAKKNTPLTRAHSKPYLEQLLCDTTLSIPIKSMNKSFDLGRTVRIANDPTFEEKLSMIRSKNHELINSS